MYEDESPRSDSQVQLAAKNIFIGIAPERKEELDHLWEKYHPRFNVLSDMSKDGKIIFDAGLYRDIRFNHRMMRAFWVASFAFWEALSALGSEQPNYDRLRTLLKYIEHVLKDDEYPEAIPCDVPSPGVLVDPKEDYRGRENGEIATFVGGWAFLHEVRHIKHQQDETSCGPQSTADEMHLEELSCDEYATKFLLEKIAIYAEESEQDRSLIEMKRQLGVYAALFSLTVISKGNWLDSETHPSIQRRIDQVLNILIEHGLSEVASLRASVAFYSLAVIWGDIPNPLKTIEVICERDRWQDKFNDTTPH
jgi:hypothetical protein